MPGAGEQKYLRPGLLKQLPLDVVQILGNEQLIQDVPRGRVPDRG